MSTLTTNNISKSWYHSALRISVLIFAVALVFESGIVSPATQKLSHLAGSQLAATIEGAPDNATYADGDLSLLTTDSVDQAVVNTAPKMISKSTFLLSTIVFILLLLIILNYTLEHLRSREKRLQFS